MTNNNGHRSSSEAIKWTRRERGGEKQQQAKQNGPSDGPMWLTGNLNEISRPDQQVSGKHGSELLLLLLANLHLWLCSTRLALLGGETWAEKSNAKESNYINHDPCNCRGRLAPLASVPVAIKLQQLEAARRLAPAQKPSRSGGTNAPSWLLSARRILSRN